VELRGCDDPLIRDRLPVSGPVVCLGLLLLAVLGTASATATAKVVTCMGLPATITGSAGNDFLIGTPGDDVIAGEGGDDSISGMGGNDTICGGPGIDIISGGAGNDRIDGGSGQEGLEGGTGNDELDGGKQVGAQSADFVDYQQAAGPVQIDLTTDQATGGDGSDTIKRVESAYGSRFDDTLIGDARANILGGEGGNDTLDGKGSADMASFDAPVHASLATDASTGEGSDQLKEMEGLIGSDGNDVLDGNSATNYLKGGGGNDILAGGGGDDRLYGDNGADEISGGAGNDTVDGGMGNDVLSGGGQAQDTVSYLSAPFSGVVVDLAGHRAAGGEGHDTIHGFRNVSGSDFSDTLSGDSAANALFGNGGSDVITGRAGADFLGGGLGPNRLTAGSGTDYCLQGLGEGRCEISGVPALPPSNVHPPLGLVTPTAFEPFRAFVPTATRGSSVEYVGAPTCRTANGAHRTTIAPPRRVDPVGNGDVPEEALWRGTLYRRSGRSWRVSRQTPWVRGQIAGAKGSIPGVPVWQDESLQRVVGRFEFTVSAGVYIWRGYVYWRLNGAHVFQPVEPHIVYGGSVRHNRDCSFG